jgi:hypothetical protein
MCLRKQYVRINAVMSQTDVSTEEIELALSILHDDPSVRQDTVNTIRELWRIFGPQKSRPRSALDTLAAVASKTHCQEADVEGNDGKTIKDKTDNSNFHPSSDRLRSLSDSRQTIPSINNSVSELGENKHSSPHADFYCFDKQREFEAMARQYRMVFPTHDAGYGIPRPTTAHASVPWGPTQFFGDIDPYMGRFPFPSAMQPWTGMFASSLAGAGANYTPAPILAARSRSPSPHRSSERFDNMEPAHNDGSAAASRNRKPPAHREPQRPSPKAPTAAAAASAAAAAAADSKRITDVNVALALLANDTAADADAIALLRRLWHTYSPRLLRPSPVQGRQGPAGS